MARTLKVDTTVIEDGGDCFVIAEIGHNHQGSVETCKRLFDAARECGVDAVKLQKRDNRALFTREQYDRPYDSEHSFGPTYGTHREALELDRDAYIELLDYASALGLVFLATAFDPASADLLADVGTAAIKIASGDLTNVGLLRHVAGLGLPMFVSTGGATLGDVDRAYEVITEQTDDLCLLQCTSGYPPTYDELNLRVIETYRSRYPETVVGLSSHDSGVAMAAAGYVLGAQVVEKHFTLDRTMRGTDHAFSLEPVGMRALVRDLRRLRVALGDGEKVPYPSEAAPLTKMSKQLVAARPLPAGHVLAEGDVVARSPGGGLAPHRIGEVIGRRLAVACDHDAPITLAVLESS